MIIAEKPKYAQRKTDQLTCLELTFPITSRLIAFFPANRFRLVKNNYAPKDKVKMVSYSVIYYLFRQFFFHILL